MDAILAWMVTGHSSPDEPKRLRLAARHSSLSGAIQSLTARAVRCTDGAAKECAAPLERSVDLKGGLEPVGLLVLSCTYYLLYFVLAQGIFLLKLVHGCVCVIVLNC